MQLSVKGKREYEKIANLIFMHQFTANNTKASEKFESYIFYFAKANMLSRNYNNFCSKSSVALKLMPAYFGFKEFIQQILYINILLGAWRLTYMHTHTHTHVHKK